jgi:hypothetical protein
MGVLRAPQAIIDASVRQAMAKMVNIRIACSWFLALCLVFMFMTCLDGVCPPLAEPVL